MFALGAKRRSLLESVFAWLASPGTALSPAMALAKAHAASEKDTASEKGATSAAEAIASICVAKSHPTSESRKDLDV